MIASHFTQPTVYVNRVSPFRCTTAPLPAELQTVLSFVMSAPTIIAAVAFAKTLDARQQYVLTRLLDGLQAGLNLAMCGERLAAAASRQFEATAEVQRG